MIKDKIKIALWWLRAYRKLALKVVLGLSFIEALVFGLITVIDSYNHYNTDYNIRHAQDCYYYSLLSEQSITNRSIDDVITYAEKVRENIQADECMIWSGIENAHISPSLVTAGNLILKVDDKEYRISDYYSQNKYYWNDIRSRNAPISYSLFINEYSEFPKKITDVYKGIFMEGEYPGKQGEILLDTYLLKMFGLQDKEMQGLLGKTVSICCSTEDTDADIICDYVLTGILYDETLPYRESDSTPDCRMEHIFVNLKEREYDDFKIVNGSVRFYYDNYTDYVKRLVFEDTSLEVKTEIDLPEKIWITGGGMQYGYMSVFSRYIGVILATISGLIILVVLLSLYYIMENYHNKMKPLTGVLKVVGCSSQNRRLILAVQLIIMTISASVIGSGYAGILFFIFNSFCAGLAEFTLDTKLISYLVSASVTGVLLYGISFLSRTNRE